MPNEFVPLSRWLAQASVEVVQPLEPCAAEEPVAEPTIDEVESAVDDAIADVRRFRAALADALDIAVAELVREIAFDVVGRELQLAPVDLRSIVDRARERYGFKEPIAIRVHPDERELLPSDIAPIVCDARLRRGDVSLEIESGTIDATLGARLERLVMTPDAR